MTNQDILLGATKENRIHSIPDFLNRFHVLERFNWSISDTRGTVLKTYRFPDQLTAIASIRNKFLNFYGLRAGVQLIVQVNSQPFQAGNLLISFLPNARYNDVKRETHEKNLQGMVSRTGAPRVNLDLMDGTRVDMCVPYASPFVFYNLFTKDGNIGDFHISVYSQLRDVAAAGFVTVTVAARFTDVELAFPIGSPLPTSSQIPAIDELSESIREKPTREKLVDLKTRTEELLSRIDAGSFQFQMNTAATSFKQKAVPHMATTNDDDLTHVLSTHSNSSLVPLQMGNTSGDDMSFNEILSIPCYHSHFTIVNTQESNTNVWSKEVEPLQAPDIVNTDSSVSADYLYTVSQLFRKWRGSIKYKFRVIKTKYHSLRVRITFAPGATAAGLANVDRDSCYSEIFDLRENNTCEFTVPYVHPFPWLNTKAHASVVPDTSLGLIIFDVHNRMVNPATVSNTIDVIVERCAGPDFELAVPTSSTLFPFDPVASQVAVPELREEEEIENNEIPIVRDLNSLSFQSPETLKELRLNRMTAFRFENGMTAGALRGLSVGVFQLYKLPWYHYIPAAIGCEILLQAAVNYVRGWAFKKDLTKEGIEPNPGPIYTTRSLITGTQSISFTSPYFGVQKIRIIVGVVPVLNETQAFDCTVSSNASPEQVTLLPRCYTYVPYEAEFYWNANIKPVLTITGQGGTTTHENYVIMQFITEGPLQFQAREEADFQFQMKSFEQDMERGGNNEMCITQPAIVTDMAKYCTGNQITHVKEMIGRSTLFANLQPTDSRGIHLMAHAFGTAQNDSSGNLQVAGFDNLSYFAHMYAFARGGVNFRMQATGSPYRIAVNNNNDINSTTSGQDYEILSQLGDALTTNEQVRLSNLMQHIINPTVEGVGEFSIPFYSSTFCYSVNPRREFDPTASISALTLPDTHTLIIPQGQLSEIQLYRNANPDFQFSYLTGPPLLRGF